jgi:transcription termination factor Rho
MTSVTSLLSQSRESILQAALRRGLSFTPNLEHVELITEFIIDLLKKDELVTTDGVLAILPDGFGFIRLVTSNFKATPIDAYVSANQIQKLNLKTGHRIEGPIRAPEGKEQFFALTKVDRVQGCCPQEREDVTVFAARTTQLATRSMSICGPDGPLDLRAIQLLAPLCFGHRLLIHAKHTWQRSQLLAKTAQALSQQHPQAQITLCLMEQRPEDIYAASALLSTTDCTIVSSVFADDPRRHVDIAKLTLSQAMRQVEQGRDVILLIDSLTALTRAESRSSAPSGAWIQPGLDAAAMQPAKDILASAQQCQEGGSLTIIATVEPGPDNTIDGAIESELSPFSNSDLVLMPTNESHDLTAGIDLDATGTRHNDDPTPQDQRQRLQKLRAEIEAIQPSTRTARWSQLLAE